MAMTSHYFLTICLIVFTAVVFEYGQCGRIIGGKPAREGEFPYQISIRRTYNDGHMCGGAIISSRYILTAAHCLLYPWGGQYPAEFISVVAGQIDLPITQTSIFRNASKLILHQEFEADTFANDIAIIELDEDLPIINNKLISAIDLNNNTIPCESAIVSGWGYTKNDVGPISDILMAAVVDVVEFEKCKEIYGEYDIQVFPGMMCAAHPEGLSDACDGDSGGPLVCNGLLVGIVSTGVECGDPVFPGIYADVASYHSWIQEHLNLLF